LLKLTSCLSPYLDMLPLFGHGRHVWPPWTPSCLCKSKILPSDWSRAFFNDMHRLLIGYGPYKRALLLSFT